MGQRPHVPLATGFHAGKFLWPMEIAGKGGTMLNDRWDGGENPRAYLGITMPDFPNLFCLYGPNTNPVVGSVIYMLECQTTYIMGCLREMIEQGHRAIDCREDVHDAFNERLDTQMETMVWRHPKVKSYYNNSDWPSRGGPVGVASDTRAQHADQARPAEEV